MATRPFAIVTGASSGIGYELAKQFAKHDFDLLIAADGDGIHQAAHDLAAFGTEVEPIQINLADHDGTHQLISVIQSTGRPVDVAAINAGVGVSGRFIETDLADEMNMVRLNVLSLLHFTKYIVKHMVERGNGRIFITSSIAGATKAFERFLAQSLREELKDTGVTITALMPGATETNFFQRAGAEDTKLGASEKDDPAEVAQEGFEALMAGKDHVITGALKNKLQAAAGYALPDPLVARAHAAMSAPGSADKK